MNRRLCLVYPHVATFVDTDCRILSEMFDVVPLEYHGKRDLGRLARSIRSTDVSFSWFVLGHAAAAVMFSRWFRKPSVVIAGGWDVAAMPEVPYGAMLSPKQRRRTSNTLERATLVLAVSASNRAETRRGTSREVLPAPLGGDTDYFSP